MIIIRSIEKRDETAVSKLLELLYLKHAQNREEFDQSKTLISSIKLIKSALKNPFYSVRVAENENATIGVAIGRTSKIENHSLYKDHIVGQILYLIVDEKYKLQGVGKQLMTHLECALMELGAEVLELRVYGFNQEAMPTQVGYKTKYTVYEKSMVHS